MDSLTQGNDSKARCWWCGEDPLYVDYHDFEWGNPVHDDMRLFEKICLEGFQSGLSWLTILRKRENFRRAFDNFDFFKIRTYTQKDVQRLLQDSGIIRHCGKIEATINNAHKACLLIEEFGSLDNYFWSYKPKSHSRPKKIADIQPYTEISQKLSKDLKKRGWKFVGPTTCYAFMQAMGMVNDHIQGCDFAAPSSQVIV
ncbi:MAG: DNA-3-methyladenine glycosylase I [Alphaproteobacteria bacterium]